MLFRLGAIAAAFMLATVGVASAQSAVPTDPQIAHIAYTADNIDIDNAKLALKKSKNKAVRVFATEMERDHSAVNKEALALLKKLKVKPQDNPTSQALLKSAKAERAKLAKLRGTAFDKAYVDNEVAFHTTVVDALRTTLIPATQNSELKSLLETGLKIFQGHLEHAEHLAAEFK